MESVGGRPRATQRFENAPLPGRLEGRKASFACSPPPNDRPQPPRNLHLPSEQPLAKSGVKGIGKGKWAERACKYPLRMRAKGFLFRTCGVLARCSKCISPPSSIREARRRQP
eukprot:6274747-Pyramimonas_sp.AAC.1